MENQLQNVSVLVGLIISVLIFTGTVAGLLMRMGGDKKAVELKFKEHGERIGAVSDSCAANTATMEEHSKAIAQQDMTLEINTRSVTHCETLALTIEKKLDKHLENAGAAEKNFLQRMTAVETTLRITPPGNHQ